MTTFSSLLETCTRCGTVLDLKNSLNIDASPAAKVSGKKKYACKRESTETNLNMYKFIGSYKCFHRILLHYPLF